MNRSSAAAVLAGLIVVGYIGFELYTLKHLSYRTEPLFIYERFIKDRHGAVACGDVDPGQLARFDRNLASIERRARRDLAETEGLSKDEAIDAALAGRRSDAEAEAAALIAPEGCDGIEAFKLKKGFENLARKNLK